jgi:hypothetical protein
LDLGRPRFFPASTAAAMAASRTVASDMSLDAPLPTMGASAVASLRSLSSSK